jgi:hypothetical protein
MASPHVAGAAAIVLGNAKSLSPAQVDARLTADASVGIVSGLTTSTTNTFLYQSPTSGSGAMSWDDEADANAADGDEPDASSASFDYLDEPTAVDRPTGAKPVPGAQPSPGVNPLPEVTPLPAVKPLPGVSVKSVTKVGKKLRVVVTAPKGAKVKIFRNGKLVAQGAKTTFVVPSTTA